MARLHDQRAALDEGRLREMLMLALGTCRGHVRTSAIAERLSVSTSTVRRWLRDGVPAARIEDVLALVRPSQRVLVQEPRDRRVYAEAVAILDAGESLGHAPSGWLDRHQLSLVKLDELGVVVPRIARLPLGSRAARRQLDGVDSSSWFTRSVRTVWDFPSRYHAALARLELLDAVSEWRVQLRAGLVDRGATQAWLASAPRVRRTWMHPFLAKKPKTTVGELRSRSRDAKTG